MSTKKSSLNERAFGALNSNPTKSVVDTSTVVTKSKTGPGAMMVHLEKESEVLRENKALKDELVANQIKIDDLKCSVEVLELATSDQKLDPKLIRPSSWSNRYGDSFKSSEFESLKNEIESAGGNVQAIKVRPIPANEQLDDGFQYEIIFGHRRHRACLELGLHVLTLIKPLSDSSLFEEMDRENRNREDLRPYEQGAMYKKALDRGLYPSLRKLVEAIGISQPISLSVVSTAIQIARLPETVLDAFPSRLDIQHRWAEPLSTAINKDPDAVLAVAKEIATTRKLAPSKGMSAKETFSRLIAPLDGSKESLEQKLIEIDGKSIATLLKVKDTYSIKFKKGILNAEMADQLVGLISSFFSEESIDVKELLKNLET